MNSEFMLAQAAYKNEVENTENELKELERKRKLIQESRLNARNHMLDVFLKNFSGSDEDVAFLLDYSQSGHNDKVYDFHQKYFTEKGLVSENLYGETNQVALKMKLSNKTDDEIRALSAYMTEQPLKIIKPLQREVMFGNKKITGYRFFEIILDDSFDYSCFNGGVHLVEQNGMYAVGSASRFNSIVVVDWNSDMAETLIKAKATLREKYTYQENEDF